jgi:hypothetical protein
MRTTLVMMSLTATRMKICPGSVADVQAHAPALCLSLAKASTGRRVGSYG